MMPQSSNDPSKPSAESCAKSAPASESCAPGTSAKSKHDKGQNRDAISGEKGAHAVGVGIGAIGGGAAAGAVGGAVAGPVGMAAGAVIGAVAGGMAGKATAEVVNPTLEEKFWREKHASRPYAKGANGYDQYAPAYKYGWECAGRGCKQGQTFDSVEGDLSRGWDKAKGTSSLAWAEAKGATRDAWERVAGTGESTRMG